MAASQPSIPLSLDHWFVRLETPQAHWRTLSTPWRQTNSRDVLSLALWTCVVSWFVLANGLAFRGMPAWKSHNLCRHFARLRSVRHGLIANCAQSGDDQRSPLSLGTGCIRRVAVLIVPPAFLQDLARVARRHARAFGALVRVHDRNKQPDQAFCPAHRGRRPVIPGPARRGAGISRPEWCRQVHHYEDADRLSRADVGHGEHPRPRHSRPDPAGPAADRLSARRRALLRRHDGARFSRVHR